MKKVVNTREHSTGDCISYIKHDEKRTNAANQKESRTNHAGHWINAQRSQGDCQIHYHDLKAYQIALITLRGHYNLSEDRSRKVGRHSPL